VIRSHVLASVEGLGNHRTQLYARLLDSIWVAFSTALSYFSACFSPVRSLAWHDTLFLACSDKKIPTDDLEGWAFQKFCNNQNVRFSVWTDGFPLGVSTVEMHRMWMNGWTVACLLSVLVKCSCHEIRT
jgi:hypothetical protein